MSGALRHSDSWAPDWAIHPGEHLAEYIESRGWTQAEFARLADLTPKLVSTILHGTNPVTADTAIKLERVLGMKARVWTELQSQWDLYQARTAKAKQPADSQDLLGEFPVRELIARGALPVIKDKAKLLDALLAFLGIGGPHSLQSRLSDMAVHHRQSRAYETDKCHVAAWLIIGEWEARTAKLPKFSSEKFTSAVHEIRKLTTEEPETFEPKMRELCHNSGVCLVLEKPLSKTCLFGSAHWIEGERAIIQMSLRLKTNDHFWWTFFHEAGHIILHKGRNFADDRGGEGDGLEDEADSWAQEILVGTERFERFCAARPKSEMEVRKFAEEAGIHPGIVVGMLQHRRIVPFKNLNKLKARFEWAE